jgi:RNA polymerase sigma-70 factor, ECF subfamily
VSRCDDDEELMACVSRGDREALATLVERYHASLLGYLYRLVGGDRALAEDLTQETFMRLLGRSHYQSGRRFRPWLYAIATNLARDHAKAAATRRHAAIAPEDELLTLRDDAPGPEERTLVAEDAARVALAVSALMSDHREVILLRFYHGLSLAEIAEALAIPLGTVKSRISIGVRRLRALLAETREEASP